jgi:DNA-binding NtrC family response regulator
MAVKILIIDDEVDMLMLLRMIIEDNTDYDVETTNNPSEALKAISENEFALIVSDLKMPGMDGLELFDEITNMRPDIPFVIITAYGSVEASERALKKGIADFITKPFRKDAILFTIKRVLEMQQLKKENTELKKKLDG